MRRLATVAAAALVIGGLSGCSQIAQLKPVAGDAVTSVRIATIDVGLQSGVQFKTAPVCTFEGSDYTCQGLADDGQPLIGKGTSMTKDEVPAEFQAAADAAPPGSEEFVVLEVTLGSETLYRGLVDTVLEQNGRADQ